MCGAAEATDPWRPYYAYSATNGIDARLVNDTNGLLPSYMYPELCCGGYPPTTTASVQITGGSGGYLAAIRAMSGDFILAGQSVASAYRLFDTRWTLGVTGFRLADNRMRADLPAVGNERTVYYTLDIALGLGRRWWHYENGWHQIMPIASQFGAVSGVPFWIDTVATGCVARGSGAAVVAPGVWCNGWNGGGYNLKETVTVRVIASRRMAGGRGSYRWGFDMATNRLSNGMPGEEVYSEEVKVMSRVDARAVVRVEIEVARENHCPANMYEVGWARTYVFEGDQSNAVGCSLSCASLTLDYVGGFASGYDLGVYAGLELNSNGVLVPWPGVSSRPTVVVTI